MVGHLRLQLGQFVDVSVEQVEHVLAGAHRALDTAQRIAVDQLAKAGERDEQFVGRRCESLAEGGGLRRDVVAATGHHQRGVLGGPVGQACRGGDTVCVYVLEGPQDLQLLDVLGEVAAGHPLVDVLVAGEGVELLDARLHVVAGDPFTVGDGGQVDLIEHTFVVGDGLVGHVDAEFLLRFEDCDPELPLQDDLVVGGPQPHQICRRIATGQDVRDPRFLGRRFCFRHASLCDMSAMAPAHGGHDRRITPRRRVRVGR